MFIFQYPDQIILQYDPLRFLRNYDSTCPRSGPPFWANSNDGIKQSKYHHLVENCSNRRKLYFYLSRYAYIRKTIVSNEIPTTLIGNHVYMLSFL